MEGNWRTIPLEVPPGFHRGGTRLASRGRWYDGDLVRWYDGVLRPVGGEMPAPFTGGGSLSVGGNGKAIDSHAWVARDGSPMLAFGSRNSLRIFRGRVPSTSKNVSAVSSSSVVETGHLNTEHWSLDNLGGDLIGRIPGKGTPFIVNTSETDLSAASLTKSSGGVEFPLAAGVVVTPERFVMAYGVAEEPNRIIWSTQGLYDATGVADWSPSIGDSAGGTYIGMRGAVLAGRRARRETLFWTTAELISAQYITQPYLYRYDIVGECTCISRRAMVVKGSEAYWMGSKNFWVYSGTVRRLPCAVSDLVFKHINRDQERLVWCERRDQFGEITWHYPSGSSVTCDRYVTFNYELGIWYFGSSPMQAGLDAGIQEHPYSVAENGTLHRMESGTAFRGAKRVPFAKTGILDIAEGRQEMFIDTIYPDENTSGELEFELEVGDDLETAFTLHGPWIASARIDHRVQGKYAQVTVRQQTAGDWRFGLPRVRMQGAGWR